MKEKIEIKVGIFVTIALLLLAVMILSIGRLHFFKKGYEFFVIFDFAGGLDVQSPVYFAGIKIGNVSKLDLIEKNEEVKVKATIWIPENIKIRRDANILINTEGLIGNKYIEITPSITKAHYIKPGDVLFAKSPLHFALFTQQLEKMVMEIQNLAKSIVEIITEGEIKGTLIGLNKAVKDVNEILTTNKKEVNITIKDFQKNIKNINEITDKVDKILEANKTTIQETLNTIKEITTSKEKEISLLITNLEKVSCKLNLLTSKIEKKEGVVGKLFYDENLEKDIVTIITDIKEITTDIKKHPWKLLRK